MTSATTPSNSFSFPPMGCGTWAWGNQVLWDYRPDMDSQLQQVFNQAVAARVTFFDTGDSYGTGKFSGQSETLLGQFAQAYQGPNQAQICLATKLAPYPWRLTAGAMVNAGMASVKRLQRPIDLVQLHWSTANYALWQERPLLMGLAKLCQQRQAKAVGLSNFGPKRLKKAHQFLQEQGIKVASVQVQYSLLSPEPVTSSGLGSLCQDLDIQLIAYSPLTLGLLTGKYSPNGPFPKGLRNALCRYLLTTSRSLLQTLQSIAESREKTMAQVALNWCIAKKTLPIPGAKFPQQLQENLGALGWQLDAGEVLELDQKVGQLPRTMIKNPFQSP